MRPSFCLMAVSLVSLSCADAVSAPGDLRLTVAVAQPAIEVGDSTTVTIRLRNGGIDPVTIATGGCFILPYIARDPGDEIVYPGGGGWACIAIVRSVTLGPGQSETQQYTVRGGAAGPSPSLGPGEYVLYATLESTEFLLRSEPARLEVLAP